MTVNNEKLFEKELLCMLFVVYKLENLLYVFFIKLINPKVAVKLITVVLHVQTAKQTANTFSKRK